MKKGVHTTILAITIFTFFTGYTYALPYQMDFSFNNFSPLSTSGPVPYDVVSGSIFYDGSTSSSLNSLTSIDLTIGSYTYDISDINFMSSPDGVLTTIGKDYPAGFSWGNDDFFLTLRWTDLGRSYFAYSTSDVTNGGWEDRSYSSGSITLSSDVQAPVPEPSTVLLLGSGLAGIALYTRKRKKV